MMFTFSVLDLIWQVLSKKYICYVINLSVVYWQKLEIWGFSVIHKLVTFFPFLLYNNTFCKHEGLSLIFNIATNCSTAALLTIQIVHHSTNQKVFCPQERVEVRLVNLINLLTQEVAQLGLTIQFLSGVNLWGYLNFALCSDILFLVNDVKRHFFFFIGPGNHSGLCVFSCSPSHGTLEPGLRSLFDIISSG